MENSENFLTWSDLHAEHLYAIGFILAFTVPKIIAREGTLILALCLRFLKILFLLENSENFHTCSVFYAEHLYAINIKLAFTVPEIIAREGTLILALCLRFLKILFLLENSENFHTCSVFYAEHLYAINIKLVFTVPEIIAREGTLILALCLRFLKIL